jgi:hypothetical protein
MARNEITVREWIANFVEGRYDAGDFKTQCEAGWYDWFCAETSLKNKTKKMGNIIKGITNDDILDNMYVFFKNNCPMEGRLYDQFKFCDIESGDVQFCISIDCDWYDSKYVVNGLGSWDRSIFECGNARELKAWFNSIGVEAQK